MGIGPNETVTPAVLKKMVYAGTNATSFRQASRRSILYLPSFIPTRSTVPTPVGGSDQDVAAAIGSFFSESADGSERRSSACVVSTSSRICTVQRPSASGTTSQCGWTAIDW